jgi:hypothetical protein
MLLAADAAGQILRPFVVVVGAALLLGVASLVWRVTRRLPDVDADPRAVLQRPDRFVASLRARRYVRGLVSIPSLLIVAVSFGAPAAAVAILLSNELGDGWAADNAWWVAGGAGVLLVGARIASTISEQKAVRYADERLQAVLRRCWTDERSLVDAWGRRHGLERADALDFTAGLDTTPLLLEGEEADYANVLRGSVAGARTTFLHLTQLGNFRDRKVRFEDDDGVQPAFRWYTCVHMKRRPRDLLMTMRPRRPDRPYCGLNDVRLGVIGDAWRASASDGSARPGLAEAADDSGSALAAIERMVAAGKLSPRVLELKRAWDSADKKQRKALSDEINREVAAWRADNPGGFAHFVDLMRSMTSGGWRKVELESVAFNQRYELRTKDADNLEVVGIFDPVLIVELTDRVGADLFVEVHNDNLLVALPGRFIEQSKLDELLATADHLGSEIDRSPMPA